MTIEPDYTAWRLVSDSKDVSNLTPQEISSIQDSLRDAIGYLQQALEKIKRAA